MKSNLKRIGIALLLLSLLLVLTSCGGPEATYKSANNLLAKGKYSEAAEKFASLGSYEDAAYLAIYADACVKGESDDPYVIMDAISIFSDLSGFKDSNMRATYYWGRFWENRGRYFEDANAGDGFQFMEQALEYYESVPLFLDCPNRIKALEKDISVAKDNAYNAALKKAESGNYAEADELFSKLGDYKDSEKRIAYYDIREAEDALSISTDHDALLALAANWSDGGEYLDCAKRAATLTEKANAIINEKYHAAVTLMESSKYEDAYHILVTLSEHIDCSSDFYKLARAFETAGIKAYAVMAYSKAGETEDASSRRNALWNKIANREIISAGNTHTIGLKADSTVVSKGSYFHGETNVSEWQDIVAISAGSFRTAGLKADGIVVGRHELRLATCGHLNYDGEIRVLLCKVGQHFVFFGERNRSLLQEITGHNQGTGIKTHSTIRIHNSNSFLYLVG